MTKEQKDSMGVSFWKAVKTKKQKRNEELKAMGHIWFKPRAQEETYCGYCDTKNNPDNTKCISCGGNLHDEISDKRNEIFFREVQQRWCQGTEPNTFTVASHD